MSGSSLALLRRYAPFLGFATIAITTLLLSWTPQPAAASGAAAIAAGQQHTCALTPAGGVQCWGYNDNGQVGDGTTGNYRTTPVQVSGLTSGIEAITAGGAHSCALTTTGGAKCWGDNYWGQVGDGTTADRASPANVAGLASGVDVLSAGGGHTCALTSAGGVKCWGANDSGQLGNGTSGNTSATPVDVIGLSSGVADVAAGGAHTCALTATGGVKCWGYNIFGQLGNGTTTGSSVPVDVSGLTSGVTAIAAGSHHTCALTTTGGVKCWGHNASSQLGTATGQCDGLNVCSSVPVDVTGLSSGVAAVSGGHEHSCARMAAGTVKCWGYNSEGQVGDGTGTARPTPVDVCASGSGAGCAGGSVLSGAAALDAGGFHTCALSAAGKVQCWGNNFVGQLGNGKINLHLSPVNVVGLQSNVAAVDTGGGHTCARTTAGGLKCWGVNGSGQIGNGIVGLEALPVDVAGLGNGVAAMATGGSHTCAVTTGGGVQCWGSNCLGQVGDGTGGGNIFYCTNLRTTPVDVCASGSGAGCSGGVALTGVAAVSAGGSHACALTTTGGVKCWGANASGELGATSSEICFASVKGSIPCSTRPLDVTGLSSGVGAISAGGGHTCVLMTAGGVKCWGSNYSGQLGDGTSGFYSSAPVDVSGLSGVVAISAGGAHTCALTTTGGVQCWGDNFYGQLGDGTFTNRTTPTAVPGLTSDVAAVDGGSGYTCAVTTAGGVKCWGANVFGQLGNGSNITSGPPYGVPSPQDVIGLASGVVFAAAGGGHTCALTSGGGVKCWGANHDGQTGDGTGGGVRVNPVDVVGLTGAGAGDSDSDGCSDAQEKGPNAAQGGLRNPNDFWDFYDVWTHPGNPSVWQRNKVVDLFGDVFGVAMRFGAMGDPGGDPLSPPTDETAYHVAFDSGAPIGANPWNIAAADGTIDLFNDIIGVANQFGHDCQAAP
ncbi:MAG: flexitail domain-containing putative surface protein [Dehalococcoidia bacterium]|nr:flexitail domain-containing putative surface protein [Dehalococcoidia bacterium]